MERVLELIGLLASGEIVVPEIQRFAHEDAAHAHKALRGVPRLVDQFFQFNEGLILEKFC